jgi:hypothetical protein
VLIAGETSKGELVGMTSREGDKVTALGVASGWTGSCIERDDFGTSFAAPAIATDILISLNSWQQALGSTAWSKDTFDVMDAKTRLLLASDVKEEYVGRIASAGVPRLERLVTDRGDYAITKEGDLQRVTVLSAMVQECVDVGAGDCKPLPRYFGFNDYGGFRGLQSKGGNLYILPNDTKQKWLKVQKGARLTVNVKTVDNQLVVFDSVDSLEDRFAAIVRVTK